MTLAIASDSSQKTRAVTLATFSSANCLKTSIATSASPASYSSVALNGAQAGTTFDPPRTVSVTTSAFVGSYTTASPIVITGTDANDKAITESLTLTAANGGETIVGAKGFKTVTQIDVPAQGNTSGAFTFGTRDLVVGRCRRIRIGAVGVIKAKEADGTIVTSPSLAAGETVEWAPSMIYGDATTTVASFWLHF